MAEVIEPGQALSNLVSEVGRRCNTYSISERNPPFQKLAVAVEELGEVSQAMQENSRQDIIEEICDTISPLCLLLHHYSNTEREIEAAFQKSLEKLR